MRNLIHRIPKPYLGFIALFFLVGATACEAIVQEGARGAVQADREMRDLEDAELGPLRARMESLQFDQIEPLQREIEDLNREIERIQRLLIDPLWSTTSDPWAVGGELYQKQELLQRQYEQIDAELRQIEVESRSLERKFRDSETNIGGFDPLARQKEDQRYDLQRELDRLYRFGQAPVDEVWSQINTINSNPGGTWDSNQFEIEQLNNKVASLYEEVNWLQSDLDNRVREKEELRTNVQDDLNNHTWYGRSDIDPIWDEIARLELELSEGTVVTVSETTTASSDELDALRAERDLLINAQNVAVAQNDSDIEATTFERDGIVASYQATIDAKNLEISLLSPTAATDSTASSTPEEVTDNTDAIAALQAEIDQAVLDRDAALVPVDEKLNTLRSDRDLVIANTQPAIDALNIQIAELENAQTETVTTTSIPDGTAEELDTLRAKVASLEEVYNAEYNKLQELLRTVDDELNVLYNGGNGPVEQIYRDIEVINGQINDLNRASEQQQYEQNDAINTLVAQAESLQQQLNADIKFIEEQLFNIDDELQRLYRSNEDGRFLDQIAFNEAQRALEDRRFDLDDQRWLLDMEQQDLYSQNNDPWKEVQAKADLIYATEIQPLQNEIFLLEEELRSLYDEQRSLERELRLAERDIRDRQRELKDQQVDDFLDFADGDPTTGDGIGVEGVIDAAINEIVDPLSEKLGDKLIESGVGSISTEIEGIDGLLDGSGDFDGLLDDGASFDPALLDGGTAEATLPPLLDAAGNLIDPLQFDEAGNLIDPSILDDGTVEVTDPPLLDAAGNLINPLQFDAAGNLIDPDAPAEEEPVADPVQ